MNWWLFVPAAVLVAVPMVAWLRWALRRPRRRSTSVVVWRPQMPPERPTGDDDLRFAVGVGQVATVLLEASERYLETRDG